MTTLREAAQQALEALENCRIEYDYHGNPIDEENANLLKSIDTLRAALAEPEPEPVTWMVYTLDGKSVCVTDNPDDFTDQHRALPLYASALEQPR